MPFKILYAGDSPVGGPANYLLGVLRANAIHVRHLSPAHQLSTAVLRQGYDAVILSDFSRKKISAAAEDKLVRQVEGGTGLLMIGGWGSFSGPFGGWHGSRVEKLLPVTCLSRDDRTNLPGGAHVLVKTPHPMFGALSFDNPPVILGLNDVRPSKKSQVVLVARKIVSVGPRLILDPFEHPLFVIDPDPKRRIAAFTTDVAPHWCGGLLDWGRRSVSLPVNRKIQIEIGDSYLRFLSSMIRWLVRK